MVENLLLSVLPTAVHANCTVASSEKSGAQVTGSNRNVAQVPAGRADQWFHLGVLHRLQPVAPRVPAALLGAHYYCTSSRGRQGGSFQVIMTFAQTDRHLPPPINAPQLCAYHWLLQSEARKNGEIQKQKQIGLAGQTVKILGRKRIVYYLVATQFGI